MRLDPDPQMKFRAEVTVLSVLSPPLHLHIPSRAFFCSPTCALHVIEANITVYTGCVFVVMLAFFTVMRGNKDNYRVIIR